MKMRQENGKMKPAIVMMLFVLLAFLAVLIITLILGVINFFIDLGDKISYEDPEKNIYFYEPNYDYDIHLDQEYVILDRRVWICEGPLSAPIEEWNSEGNVLYQFIADYFYALEHGEGGMLRSMYTNECILALKIPSKFTMQRIYDIMATVLSSQKNDEGNMVYNVKVEYKIMKNDGTFRKDMGSDGTKPQELEITYDGTNIQITDVIIYK